MKMVKKLLTGKIIDMGNNDLIISGINKTENNNYAVIFYDNVKNGKQTTVDF
jgi:broad specificity polyphosphatase/5'/3'-nucleotidase SurE